MLQGVLLDSAELRQFVSRSRKLTTIKMVVGRRQYRDAVVKETTLESLIFFLDEKLEGAGPILRGEELRDEHFEGATSYRTAAWIAKRGNLNWVETED